MNWLTIISFVGWIYLLSILARGKLDFWYFCVGSIGLFIFMMLWIQPIVTTPLSKMVAATAGIFGKINGMFQSYFEYGILFIQREEEVVSLYIDYECSGIIEIMAFCSLLCFFSVYRFYEKVIVSISGIIVIFFSNVLRLLVICTMIYIFGNKVYYLAHTIFGRFVFYFLSIALYFYVFTKPQIVRQKIGSFKYESD